LVVVTDALLLTGLAAALLFVVVLLVEGALRAGYDPAYHTGSELGLGARGWIQRMNFIVMSAGTFAFATGVQRSLDSTIGPVLLAVFGAGLIIAGMFPPDPVRGYPPGAPIDREADLTLAAKIHDLSGPVMFLALLGACIALARQLQGGWRLYTMLTAGLGFVLMVWTAVAYQREAANTGRYNAASSSCTGAGSRRWPSTSSQTDRNPDLWRRVARPEGLDDPYRSYREQTGRFLPRLRRFKNELLPTCATP
jgi:hypothetical protein